MLHFENSRCPLDFGKVSKGYRHLESTGTLGDPMDRLRLLCLSRGDTGILDLGRLFRRLDEDNDKNLIEKEFILGLRESGLEITDEEAQDMFEQFDTANIGRISIDDFLAAMRPPMSKSQKRVIEKAFRKIDADGNGEITMDELKNVYNVQHHPLYRSGAESEDVVLQQFLNNFAGGAPKDGHLTREEFTNYYAAICATSDNDFDLMMRQCYKL